MRDLHVPARSGNGAGAEAEMDLGEPETSMPLGDLTQPIRQARRDQKIASITVMLLDAAEMVKPLVDLLHTRMLRWFALAASLVLAWKALSQPSWERLAIVATFMLLATFMLRGGR
jgi:hypothetical protein